MTVLITGASGFIGKHVDAYLESIGFDILPISSKTCNLLDRNKVIELVKDFKPKYIVHLAANANGNAGDAVISDNFNMTKNLLDASVGIVDKFVFGSSIVVYGNNSTPQKEDGILSPTSYYGISKVLCDNLCNFYLRYHQLKTVSLRMCAVVGKGMTHGLLKDVIRKIKESDKSIELFGQCPGARKPYVHVNDVSYIIGKTLKEGYTSPIVNISSNSISVKDVAEKVMSIIGTNRIINWNEEKIWRGDNNFLCADYSLLTSRYLTPQSSVDAIAQATREELENYKDSPKYVSDR